MVIGYLSFGRVPGCLGLGALFLCGGGTNGGTNGQTASGAAARQKTQTLSMPRRNDRTRHDHAAVPLAVCPFWFFGGVRCGGLTGGGGPSALRWMAAGAEFPCDVPGGGVASALRWMWVG